MTEINNVRIVNVRKLIEQHDNSPTKLASKLGYKNGAFLVQMAGPNPSRRITEKTARAFESALNLPEGWLDRDENTGAPAPADHHHEVAAPQGPLSPARLTSVIRSVAGACEKIGVTLTHEKFADVVALIYAESVESGREPSDAHIARLIGLLK